MDLSSAGEQRCKETTGTRGGSRHGHWQQYYILTVSKVVTFNFVLTGNNSVIFTKKKIMYFDEKSFTLTFILTSLSSDLGKKQELNDTDP